MKVVIEAYRFNDLDMYAKRQVLKNFQKTNNFLSQVIKNIEKYSKNYQGEPSKYIDNLWEFMEEMKDEDYQLWLVEQYSEDNDIIYMEDGTEFFGNIEEVIED